MIDLDRETSPDFEAGLPDLFPDLEDVDAVEKWRGMHAYVRCPPNFGPRAGWVQTAPSNLGNRRDYEVRGFKYLFEYGEFLMCQGDGEPKAKDMNGAPWHSFKEPYKLILQKGGAKEFPISQIISMHWHVRPPFRGVRFPQMEGPGAPTIYDFECPECQGREHPFIASSTSRRQAAGWLRQHLTSGINKQHDYSVADLRELGAEIKIDFTTNRIGMVKEHISGPAPATVEEDSEPGFREAEATLAAVPTYNVHFRCTECEWAPLLSDAVPAASLSRHKKKEHATA